MRGSGDSANLAGLRARAARLERELYETRRLIGEAAGYVQAAGAELARNRGYAFDAASLPADRVVSGCVDSLRRYGFTVIDHVIPPDQVAAVRGEAVAAQRIIDRNIAAIRSLQAGEAGTDDGQVDLRPVRRAGHPAKPPNDIVWLPRYAHHLANPVVTALARRVLDDHLRIAQLHLRIIEADRPDGTPGGFGPVQSRGREFRGWHTDWPHDLSAYGAGDPFQNVGCVRQPFPDVTMCLVMIWYLTDVDAESGGTWVVPGSHRDKRNPRGPEDGISIVAPIPGELQVSAPAGSVYIQDSRSWHASAMHNTRHDRVAVVNRWAPWWLSVDDFAPGNTYNTNMVCRPLSHAEYRALPPALQPLMRHLCPDEHDTLQQPVLDRAAAAARCARDARERAREAPASVARANAHIRVRIDPADS
ncbi:MAG: phytanoyl-CoA dioxygenase family protein [Spirochaetaceae bacterium]|nr:phytanoyl-CoA dioxygenase family protein [Spirochaetaceae bacterium]